MTERRPARDPASHIGFLDEVEDKKRRKKSQKAEDGLDLDRIW